MTLRTRRWVRRWWEGDGGWTGRLADAVLAPAEWAFRGAAHLRNRLYDRGWLKVEHAPIRVISVGNLGVGGAGKTPFAAFLAARLQERGWRPGIVLRGYGTDELLLHREWNPEVEVFAAPRRIDGIRRAARTGCNVAILDDAFQHRRIARELDVVLVPVESWSERPQLLPRGPWRETLAALRRADVAVLTWKSANPTRVCEVYRSIASAAPIPLVGCRVAPAGLMPLHPGARTARELAALAGEAILAVASVADPRPFMAHLKDVSTDVELASFPDHHPFRPADARDLLRRADGRTLVMTHKDAVKLRPLLSASTPAWILRQEVVLAWGRGALDVALRRVLGPRRA